MSSEKGKPFVRSGRHGPHCDRGGQSPRATLQLPLAYHFCPWEARLTQAGQRQVRGWPHPCLRLLPSPWGTGTRAATPGTSLQAPTQLWAGFQWSGALLPTARTSPGPFLLPASSSWSSLCLLPGIYAHRHTHTHTQRYIHTHTHASCFQQRTWSSRPSPGSLVPSSWSGFQGQHRRPFTIPFISAFHHKPRIFLPWRWPGTCSANIDLCPAAWRRTDSSCCQIQPRCPERTGNANSSLLASASLSLCQRIKQKRFHSQMFQRQISLKWAMLMFQVCFLLWKHRAGEDGAVSTGESQGSPPILSPAVGKALKLFCPPYPRFRTSVQIPTSTRLFFVAVQLLSHVPLSETPWTTTRQASLSFTVSRS